VLDKIRYPVFSIVAGNVPSRITMFGRLDHDDVALLKWELVGIIDRNSVEAVTQ
jgi:hypothetical protein